MGKQLVILSPLGQTHHRRSSKEAIHTRRVLMTPDPQYPGVYATVPTYVCMYIGVYIRMYVYRGVQTYVRMYIGVYIRMYVCI